MNPTIVQDDLADVTNKLRATLLKAEGEGATDDNPKEDDKEKETIETMRKYAKKYMKRYMAEDGGEGAKDDEEEGTKTMKKYMKKYMAEDGEKEDDYDPKTMKKYMKKLMAEDKEDTEELMKKYMKKAGDAYMDITQLAGYDKASAVIVDGTTFLKAFKDLGQTMCKAVGILQDRIESLEDEIKSSKELAAVTGAVVLKANETLSTIAKQPLPVKGTFIAGAPIQKSDSGNNPYKQIEAYGLSRAKGVLLKAAQEGNENAGIVLKAMDMSQNIYQLPEQMAVTAATLLSTV